MIATEGKLVRLVFLSLLLIVSVEFVQSLRWFPGPYTILHSFWLILGVRKVQITFKVSRLNLTWSFWLKNSEKKSINIYFRNFVILNLPIVTTLDIVPFPNRFVPNTVILIFEK